MNKISFTILLALLVLSPALFALPTSGKRAKAPKPEDVSKLLEPIRKKHSLPALGGAIVDGQHVIGIGASGVRKMKAPSKATSKDLWHLGSCGKAMTATLIARLVEKKKLKWDTTIEQVFPKLKKTMQPEYRKVTLVQLLSHRGGFSGNLVVNQPDLWAKLARLSGNPQKARVLFVKEILKVKPEATPGTKHIYSNAGYTMAGAIAEKVTGKSYEVLMKREVFLPLGMKSAGFGSPVGKQPWGHLAQDKGGAPVLPGPFGDNPQAISPAGTIHCTLMDWGKFISAHMVPGKGKKAFLKETTLKKLHTSIGDGDYALGWVTKDRPWGGGEPVLFHNGTNTMWYAVVWATPKNDFAVLVTTNQGGHSEACNEAAIALMRHYSNNKKK